MRIKEIPDNTKLVVPIPPSHLKELEKRLKRLVSDPGRLLTFEELKRRIEKRK